MIEIGLSLYPFNHLFLKLPIIEFSSSIVNGLHTKKVLLPIPVAVLSWMDQLLLRYPPTSQKSAVVFVYFLCLHPTSLFIN